MTAVVAAACVAAAACGGFPLSRDPAPVHRVPSGDGTARWTATLAPAGASGGQSVRGTAAMRSGFDDAHTWVSVELTDGSAGGVHPWQLRRGRCGADEGGFGAGDAFPPLAVDSGGHASGGTTVSGATPRTGGFYVRVGASPADPVTTVACGRLAPP